MKINKLTVTAIAVAAFTTAPLFTPAITSFAATNTAKTTTTATTAETPINRNGHLRFNRKHPSFDTFDAHGNNRNRPITTFSDIHIVSKVVINGQEFYRLQYDTYVRASDVSLYNTKPKNGYMEDPMVNGISTGDYPETTIYDVNGKPTGEILPAHTTLRSSTRVFTNYETFYKTNRGLLLARDIHLLVWRDNEVKVNGTLTIDDVRFPDGTAARVSIYNDKLDVEYNDHNFLPAGTTWKVFFKVDMNGQTYYNVGGNQYVLAKQVTPHLTVDGTTTPSQTPTEPSRPSTQKAKVGTVQYVPGYGIQVWTKDHAAVHNADGSLKKLAHKTSWKVFDETTINGKAFYNLGGDQWIEANYMSLR